MHSYKASASMPLTSEDTAVLQSCASDCTCAVPMFARTLRNDNRFDHCRYDQYLFYGRDRLKELSYVSHLQYISDLFEDLGIKSKKKTHAPRGSAARDTYENRCTATFCG